MQSNNPVFRRSEEFNTAAPRRPDATDRPGLRPDPAQWGTGTPARPARTTRRHGGRMTIDSVVQKTAITLVVVILAAAATWILTPDIDASDRPARTSARSSRR